MALSKETREKTGNTHLPERGEDWGSLLGTRSRVTPILSKTEDELSKAEKAEQKALRSNALDVEDHDLFRGINTETGKGADVITPTFNPLQLSILAQQNNTLLQAISAMEINIDGTGFEIEKCEKAKQAEAEEEEEAETDEDGNPVEEPEEPAFDATPEERQAFQDEKRKKEVADHEAEEEKKKAEQAETDKIKEFFDQPYPDMSFTTIRRKLRRDVETTGNAYLEVIRDSDGEIAMLNWLDANLTRMVKLDDPILVEKTVERFGKEVKLNLMMRERRFAQVVGTKLVYFREFGASRKLHREHGFWEDDEKLKELPEDKRLTQENEATEVIHFTAIRDVTTNYGVPRWVNQIPSVLGSRKAEEYNLEFFNHGGLPPAMIMIQGGSLSDDARKNLTDYMAGKAKFKQRGVITEVFSTSGDLGHAGSVKVTVERFGTERQQDSMFENYDERCAQRVRGAFRLPPLFLGLSQDHNFATAYVSYMIAERQVFKPERDEFDEVINVKIMKELAPDYKFRSKGIGIHDVEQQFKGIELVRDLIDPTKLVEQVNEMVSLTLEPKEDIGEEDRKAVEDEVVGQMAQAQEQAQRMAQTGQAKPGDKPLPPNIVRLEANEEGKIKAADEYVLSELAGDWAKYLSGNGNFSVQQVATMRGLIENLTPDVQEVLKNYVGLVLKVDDIEAADLLTKGGLMKYDPSQPRDDAGRWEAAGASAAGAFSPGQEVRFDGTSIDGAVIGSMSVKVIVPWSNSGKVTSVDKRGRAYEGASKHIPAALVERPAYKNRPARQFEVYHHTLKR